MRAYRPLAAVMVACLAAMLLQEAYGAQDIAFRKNWAWLVGGMRFYPGAFHDDGFDWGWQRVVMLYSHGFWHLGWLHLGVNMAMLAVVGGAMTRQAGPGRFLVLYLGVMPLAALAYAWANGPEGAMAGASGAIHGVAGAVMGGAALHRRWTAAAGWAAGVAAANIGFAWATGGQFAWELHLAGVVLGMLAAPVLWPGRLPR